GLLVLAAPAAAGEPELGDEELVERETAPALLTLPLAAWAMQRGERVGPLREPGGDLDRRGERVRVVARVVERLPDQLTELLDGDLLARRVDGCEVGRRGGAVYVVRADRELVAPQLPAQPDACAGLELVGEPDLVEPDRGDLAALVRDSRLDDRQP